MALSETIHDTDIDLFRQELVNLIDHQLQPLGFADRSKLAPRDARDFVLDEVQLLTSHLSATHPQNVKA